MKNLLPSIIRTFSAQVAALIIVALLRLSVKIDTATALIWAQQLIAAAYYVAVRALEELRSSKWGWLLGSAKKPTYIANQALAAMALRADRDLR